MKSLTPCLCALGLLTLAACADGGSAAAPPSPSPPPPAPPPSTRSASPQAGPVAGEGSPTLPGGKSAAESLPPVPRERLLIREARVAMEVKGVAATATALARLAAAEQGFVVSSADQARGERGAHAATVVLRAPAARFDAVLEQVEALATSVESVDVQSSDITEEFVDVEARLKAKRALEERYLQLLQQAGSVHDALEVERALAEVRQELERFEGRRRYLADRTQLSTFTVLFHEPYPSALAEGGGVVRTLRQAVGDGTSGMVRLLYAAVVVTIAASPLAVAVLLLLVAGKIWQIRRRRRRAASPPAPPATPLAGA